MPVWRLQRGRLRRRHRGIDAGEVGADLLEEAVELHVDCDADRIGEAERVGRAVALYRDAAQPEEHRPVVAARVEALAALAQRAAGKEIADLRHRRIAERTL